MRHMGIAASVKARQTNSTSRSITEQALLDRLKHIEPALRSKGALEELLIERAAHPAGSRIVADHDFHTPSFVAAGWTYRQRVLADGRRQVFGFGVPGDLVAVCAPYGDHASFSVFAVTPVVTVIAVPLFRFLLKAEEPGTPMRLYSTFMNHEREMLLNQVTRLGRQTAIERIAHFLMELHHRLETVNLAANYSFSMPLTQELLADALGLSVVHVNRILQQLRRQKLLQVNGGAVVLLKPETLRAIGEFDDSRLERGPAAPDSRASPPKP